MSESKQYQLARIEPQALIASAIEKGATIETIERLVALAKDVRREQAKEAYYEAKATFQKNCPVIAKTKTARINTRSGGSYNYQYSPLDAITEKISPVLGSVGISVSYRLRQEKEWSHAVCVLTHELGHSEESGEVSMPVIVAKAQDGSVVGANPAQCIGIAQSYAKRYALLAITGLAPRGEDKDGDGQKAKPDGGRPIVNQETVMRERERQADAKSSMSEEISHQGSTPETTGNEVECHVNGVTVTKGKSGQPFAKAETTDGTFHALDSAMIQKLGLAEGQDVRIEFKSETYGKNTFRVVKDIDFIAPRKNDEPKDSLFAEAQ